MRRILPLMFATLLLSFCAVSADEPKRTINFINAPVEKILPFYHELSGFELVVSSDVRKLHTAVTIRSAEPVSKSVMRQLIENALLEQAGVVISRLDAKRVSVTYNDALPIIPAGDGD
jgi:type II secretory pathway component GspD/PulD (secretin)